MTQLALALVDPDQEHVDRLVAAGHTPVAAHRLIDLFRRVDFNVLESVDRHLEFLADAIAVCPHCCLTWSVETATAWWLKYDRCYLCMRDATGLDHAMSDDELRPFLVANPPARLPKGHPRRVP